MILESSVAFWAFGTFVATAAFRAWEKKIAYALVGLAALLCALNGAGILAQPFWTSQINAMFGAFGRFGSSNLLINVGAGTAGTWIGGKIAQ